MSVKPVPPWRRDTIKKHSEDNVETTERSEDHVETTEHSEKPDELEHNSAVAHYCYHYECEDGDIISSTLITKVGVLREGVLREICNLPCTIHHRHNTLYNIHHTSPSQADCIGNGQVLS